MASLEERVRDFLVELVRVATTRIPDDVVAALERAYREETDPLARKQFEAILRNIELARSAGAPVCQDTGTPYFYIKLGDGFPLRSSIYRVVEDAIRKATAEVPLRPNAVDPFRERNSGDNTGRYTPWVEVELVPGDTMEVTYVAKGGGSEAPSIVRVVPPIGAEKRLREIVLRAVVDAGPKPCPPVVVGVGIAAGADQAAALAKKAAVLRPLGQRHPDPEAAKLEEELLQAINRLGIGPHGFGGRFTALDVHVEYAFRHPASYAIGVVFSCWALRRATGIVRPDGSWEITSHRR